MVVYTRMRHGARRVCILTLTALLTLLILLVPMVVASPRAVAATTYTITDLGTLGSSDSYAYDLNAVGQVTGYSGTASGKARAFLWTPSTSNGETGVMTDLGTLSGGNANSYAFAINSRGDVAGQSEISGGTTHAFAWSNMTKIMYDLSTLGGANSYGYGINDNGHTVGESNLNAQKGGQLHAFWWPTCCGLVELGTLGGPTSVGYAINTTCQIVGRADTARGPYHAFLWTPVNPCYGATGGVMTDLGTLGGSKSSALGFNKGGQVIGFAYLASGQQRAFLWDPNTPNGTTGQMADLGTLGGTNSVAEGINTSGQVVGVAQDAHQVDHAFLWPSINGLLIDLNGYLPANSGWVLGYARAINDSGQIVGGGTIHGRHHAFLLTPHQT